MVAKKATAVRAVAAPRRMDAQEKRWEAQDALRTLQRADEIMRNKTLLAAAKREAAQQAKALTSVMKKGK